MPCHQAGLRVISLWLCISYFRERCVGAVRIRRTVPHPIQAASYSKEQLTASHTQRIRAQESGPLTIGCMQESVRLGRFSSRTPNGHTLLSPAGLSLTRPDPNRVGGWLNSLGNDRGGPHHRLRGGATARACLLIGSLATSARKVPTFRSIGSVGAVPTSWRAGELNPALPGSGAGRS
jgi:hypothetical protein